MGKWLHNLQMFSPITTNCPKEVNGYTMKIKPNSLLFNASPECAVKNHLCDTKSLGLSRVSCCTCGRGIKTIFGLNSIFDWNHSQCLSALPISSLARVQRHHSIAWCWEIARSAVLADVKSAKKICGRVWLWSLNVPQIFLVSVHFCVRDSRMWQSLVFCLFRRETPVWEGFCCIKRILGDPHGQPNSKQQKKKNNRKYLKWKRF